MTIAMVDDEVISVSRTRAERIIASITLTNLSAPAALGVIAGLIAASWAVAYFLGGGIRVAPNWFYVPIFLAALRFGPLGALTAGLVSTYIAGPLLPADVATNTTQTMSDWISRGIFFVLIGQLVALLFVRVQRLATRREYQLQATVELSAIELAAREVRFSALVYNSSDLVTIIDSDGTIVFQSPSVTRILGWDEEHWQGRSILEALNETDQPLWSTIVEVLIEDSAEMTVEWKVRHANGSWRHLQTIVTNLTHEPSVGGFVLNSRDITDQKALEEQLRHQAFHDPLTGLANRAYFTEQLEQALRRRNRVGGGLALLFIDLDKFKIVNDLHGHALGDELLKQTAKRLRATLRDADAIARLGGDEFAILFEAVAIGSYPRSAAERITKAFAEPFSVGSTEIFLTVSVGISVDELGNESADDLLRSADLAMYSAKVKNEGGIEVFTSGMHSKILQRMQIEADLRRALSEHEFEVHYQPIIDNSSGTMEAVEALIRWNHPERGLVMPCDFIPVAESSAICVQVGAWMLEHACLEFMALTRELKGGGQVGLSVNVAARQLRDPTLFETVCAAAATAGLDPRQLTLEITESTIMEDLEMAVDVLNQLRTVGVKIAIDDFGTGNSSLSLLNSIPIDTLKIDRTFIMDVTKRPEPAQLLRAILQLAVDFGFHTVAEGVEEMDQHHLLTLLGCQATQGFYFARPQPVAQLLSLLRGGTSLARPTTSK